MGDQLQIQFTGSEIELLSGVDIYDLDLFDTTPDTIKTIHNHGGYVICYLNAGAWEDWRPDADQYPAKILGKDYTGWPGEKWVDIRDMDQLERILSARTALCQQKGFDGIEPDNLDGFQNETGFPISAEDQIAFNRWLAGLAHSYNLSIGLKNDPDQIELLESDFDFLIMEECFQYAWCDNAAPFLQSANRFMPLNIQIKRHRSPHIVLIPKSLEFPFF